MKHKRTLFVSLLAVLAAGVVAGSAVAAAGKPLAGKPIVIGAAIAKTGFISGYDYPAVIAGQLAADDINKKGGVLGRPLKIVVTDTKSDRAQGATAALDAIKQRAVLGLVTCDLDFAAPAATTFAGKGIVSMSLCAGAPNFGPKGISPLAFSAGISTPNEAAGGAQFAYQIKKWRTTYTIVDTTIEYDTTWMEFFQKSFKAWGGKVLGSDTFQNNDSSVQAQITRLKALKQQPDFVTVCSYQPGGPTALRQIRAAGINLPLLICVGMDGTNWLPSVPGLKDTFVTDYANYLGHDPNPGINNVYKRYVAKQHSDPPQGHFIEGYGAVELLALAIKKAGTTDGEAVKKALESFKNVKHLTGPTTFTDVWHVSFNRPVAIEEIKNGTIKFVAKFVPKHVFYPTK